MSPAERPRKDKVLDLLYRGPHDVADRIKWKSGLVNATFAVVAAVVATAALIQNGNPAALILGLLTIAQAVLTIVNPWYIRGALRIVVGLPVIYALIWPGAGFLDSDGQPFPYPAFIGAILLSLGVGTADICFGVKVARAKGRKKAREQRPLAITESTPT